MRKIIPGLVADTPVAAPIVLATSAKAVVSHDATHEGVITGHVDKGDAQPLLTGFIGAVAS